MNGLPVEATLGLAERIAGEGRTEAACPNCGRRRAYVHVWHDANGMTAHGRLRFVCRSCDPATYRVGDLR